jgi:hypothetical protein
MQMTAIDYSEIFFQNGLYAAISTLNSNPGRKAKQPKMPKVRDDLTAKRETERLDTPEGDLL